MRGPLADAALLLRTGKPAKAAASLLPLLRKSPGHAPLRYLLGVSYLASGEAKSALFHLQTALELDPGNVAIIIDFARAQAAAGDRAGAITSYQRLLTLDPRHITARAELTEIYLSADETALAEELQLRTLRAHPDLITAWMGLVQIGMVTCRAKECAARLREAIGVNPQRPELDSYLGVTLTYLPGVPCEEVFAAHRDFGIKTMSHIRTRPPAFTGSRDPERPLVLGWLSPDLRQHSIAHFLEPLLTNLDPASFTSVLLASNAKRDDVTRRLSAHGRLVPCHDLEPLELAELVRREQIDILIELSGHTTNHRLFSLARKPAPLIVSYLGYANTTGLPTIDYRVVDPITDPPANGPAEHRLGLEDAWPWDDGVSLPWPGAEAYATERLSRIEAPFVCYRPPDESPQPSPPPSQARVAPITLGSFNAMHKLAPEVVALWCRAMLEIPGSRIILKGDYRLSAARTGTLAWFAAGGISADRVELRGLTSSVREHLAQYADIDIALDTFPYNGTTTTCEALHMGVPVVTLAGRAHASRVGCSLLTTLGLRDLVCTSPGGFVSTLRDLASDPARLAELRRTLRPRLAASSLCNGPSHAARFGTALRTMWRRYVQEQAADPL